MTGEIKDVRAFFATKKHELEKDVMTGETKDVQIKKENFQKQKQNAKLMITSDITIIILGTTFYTKV